MLPKNLDLLNNCLRNIPPVILPNGREPNFDSGRLRCRSYNIFSFVIILQNMRVLDGWSGSNSSKMIRRTPVFKFKLRRVNISPRDAFADERYYAALNNLQCCK